MRLVKSILTVMLLAAMSFATPANVTGHLKNASTGVVTGTSWVRFDLVNCGQNTPRLLGSGVLVQPYYDFRPDASGVIKADDGTSTATIYKRTDIDCGGTNNSRWKVTYFVDGEPMKGVTPLIYDITDNFDLDNPPSPGALPPSPVNPINGIRYRGVWSSLISYVAYDTVTYSGSSYIALVANINVTPGTDGSKWSLIAAKGDVGATGAQGPQGDKGDKGDSGASIDLASPGQIGGTTPSGITATGAVIEDLQAAPAAVVKIAIYPDVAVHQGYAYKDASTQYVFDTLTIKKLDGSWAVVSSNTTPYVGVTDAPQGPNFHLGDGDYYNGKLYVPAETFASCVSFSGQKVLVYDATTLALSAQYDISAQNHEVSSVAADPANNLLWVSSYCDKTQVFKYNLTTLAYIGAVTLTPNISWIQGIAINGTTLYAGGTGGQLWSINESTGAATQLYASPISTVSHEGLDYHSSELRWLIDQGTGNQRVHAFKFTGNTFVAGPLFYNNGQLLLPDGTASIPSLAPINDAGTGFFRTTAGELRFTSNTVDTGITLSSTGITTAQIKLGSLSSEATIYHKSVSTPSTMYAISQSSGGVTSLNAASGQEMNFKNGGSRRFRVMGTGSTFYATDGTTAVASVDTAGKGTFASIATAGQITSTLATGTAPLVIASTTAVSNLNADMLDDKHAADFIPTTRQVIAGAGLTGGGALSGDVTIAADIDTDVTLAANSDVKIPSQKAAKAYVDAKLSSAANVATDTSLAYWRDDFMAGIATAGSVGELGWQQNGGGGQVIFPQPTAADILNHPGVIELNGQTGTTGWEWLVLTNYNTAYTTSRFDIIKFDMTWIAAGETAVTDTFQMRIGATDNSGSTTPANGIYFEVNNNGSAQHWFCVTRKASVQTATDSGVTYTVNAWPKFRIVGDGLGTITFYINGVQVAQQNTNVPTVILQPGAMINNAGQGSTHRLWLDLFLMTMNLTR